MALRERMGREASPSAAAIFDVGFRRRLMVEPREISAALTISITKSGRQARKWRFWVEFRAIRFDLKLINHILFTFCYGIDTICLT